MQKNSRIPGADFAWELPTDRPAKILFLTDMQIIDSSRRHSGRLSDPEIEMWRPEHMETLAYTPMRKLIRETMPDLILLGGDLVYGEFDDGGENFRKFTEFFEGFKIPWAPVYGNHDNEARFGAEGQNAVLEAAEHCFFAGGDVTGNGNYTVAFTRDGKPVRMLFCLDSHGAHTGIWEGKYDLMAAPGIHDDQKAFVKKRYDEARAVAGDIPSFFLFHIASDDFEQAYRAAGYQPESDASRAVFHQYEIGKTTPARNRDFGAKHEFLCKNRTPAILPEAKYCHADGVFVGHDHNISTSVLYEGIRWTYGVKTGVYDYHTQGKTGGTLITLTDTGFTLRQIFQDIPEDIDW